MRILLFLAAVVIIFIFGFSSVSQKKVTPKLFLAPSTITVKSNVFSPGQLIPRQFTCDGGNINPPLTFSNAPQDAVSIAVVMDDSDAKPVTLTHWLVWNIAPNIKEVNAGVRPAGSVEGNNDFGQSSYDGPCPPTGVHHYYFHIYALDTRISLTPDSKRKDLDRAVSGHILASGELMGIYRR